MVLYINRTTDSESGVLFPGRGGEVEMEVTRVFVTRLVVLGWQ